MVVYEAIEKHLIMIVLALYQLIESEEVVLELRGALELLRVDGLYVVVPLLSMHKDGH